MTGMRTGPSGVQCTFCVNTRVINSLHFKQIMLLQCTQEGSAFHRWLHYIFHPTNIENRLVHLRIRGRQYTVLGFQHENAEKTCQQ